MNTLKLKNPIKVNGREVSELTHDADKITCELYEEAGERANSGAGAMATCLRLGMAAILAVNKEYSWEDLERITGSDLRRVAVVGGNFITSAEDAPDETSAEQ